MKLMVAIRSAISSIALLAMLLVGLDAWAEPVRVRTSTGDGYGRMTFQWAQPVGHQAQKNGDRLVINFSRPIEADLRRVVRGLSRYIASAEAAPNDATVVFRVKGDFSVRSYDSGSSVVVDIVSAAQAETPTPKAEQTAPTPAASASGPNVPVRTGAHDAYMRVVFDWPANTAFSVVRDGGKAILNFDKAASVNLARLASGRVRNISGASATAVDGKLSVTLNVDPTSRVNAFASGPKVVVDVYNPGSQAPAQEKAPVAEVAQAETAPEPQAANEPPAPEPAPVAPVELAKVDPAPAPESAPQEAPASAAPAPLSLEPAQPADPATPLDEGRVDTRAEATQGESGGVVLKFDWDEPVGAAVFRRGEDLWVVFDKRANVDTEALVRDGAGLIQAVEQVPSRYGAVLRMNTAESVNPSIKRAGLAWVLEFLPQPLIPSAPLQVDAQPDSPLGARLFVAVPEPGNIIAFRDPEVGDNLIVAPVIPLGHGMSRQWSYPQMRLLPSKQGVVMKPLSDDLRIRPLRQGVEITSTGTLQVSGVSPEQKANVELQQQIASGVGMAGMGPLTRVLDLEKWKRPDLASFTETKQELQRDVAFSKNNRTRKQAQRELLLFFFANGFEAEALGVIHEMVRAEPEYENEPEARLIRGAASWMMGRMEDARKDLYHPSLDAFDEATFWRAAVVAGEGKLEDAAYELRKTGQITQPYPKSIKMPTGTLVAAAAVELGDVKQATQYLEVLSLENPSRAQKDQIDYVAGKLKELSGEFDAAVADWETVMEGRHRPSRAKAAVARTELLLKLGHFTEMDAIEEYEKLRFVWRGDDFEFVLLRRLGSLYLDRQLYREGLRTLRQAATYFPNHVESNQVTKQMSDAFQMLYLENGADVLPPVTAIALYDEFRELTPPGDLGDTMIRRLADRLVQVDLLGRAADLLEAQIEFRLKGEDKARVGARLALIYLFDRQYDRALKSLNSTETPNINDQLAQERTLLRAQAHIGLEEPDMTLELLGPLSGEKPEMMRAGVYWRAKDWQNAAKSLAALARDVEAKPRKRLDEKQAAVVLALAIAYTLDGNEVAVQRSLDNYGPAMLQTSYADAFRLIAEPPETGMVNFRGLEPIVKKVEAFQGFMELYRQRVTDGQLSSLY